MEITKLDVTMPYRQWCVHRLELHKYVDYTVLFASICINGKHTYETQFNAEWMDTERAAWLGRHILNTLIYTYSKAEDNIQNEIRNAQNKLNKLLGV